MASVLKVDTVLESTPGVGTNFGGVGSASAPTLSIGSQTNKGFYDAGSNTVGFTAGGQRVGQFGPGYGGFTGNVIQVAYEELTTSGVSSSVQIPVDNTIPQQSEGGEILTCSITPRYANSILYVESNSFIGENTNNSNFLTVALFRDSDANAIASSFYSAPGFLAASPLTSGTHFAPITITSRVIANSTSSTTFKLRAGGDGAGAIRWNGAIGVQYFAGTLITYIKITEIQV